MKKESNVMWGGRFELPPNEIMQEINESISYDKRFAKYDIAGSKAHCKMLVKQNILTKDEGQAILDGLDIVTDEIKSGVFDFNKELEDIHMNVEHRLSELIGNVAGKLHTARSRNDQVAVDFRMWVREAFKDIKDNLIILEKTIIKKADENFDTILPGFTHLQSAQPVTFGHHLMLYFEMLLRDIKKINNNIDIMNECPLGAGALAGTSFNLDREFTSKELNFKYPTRNSMDSVADRDFVLDFLYTLSLISLHLSRMAEELCIWSSAQFAFIRLSDLYTTGSSIMPQKKNPDSVELIRGKSGRVFGHLFAMIATLKGLAFTYQKDMQEDKEGTFDAYDTVMICLKVMNGVIETMTVNKEKMFEDTEKGFITATDLADWLVQNLNIPFRKAHSITGKIVKLAENKDCRLDELNLKDMQEVENGINENVYRVLKLESSVNSRKSFGGTAPDNVKKAIKEASKILNEVI